MTLPTTFLATAALVVLGAVLAFRTVEKGRGSNAVGFGLIAAGTLAALWLAARTLLPGTALAEADLEPRGAALHVPAHEAPVVLDVHGTPAHAAMGQHTTARYEVEVRQGGNQVLRKSGTFDEHWSRRRVGRGTTVPSVAMHTDDRLVLPPAAEAEVVLTRVDGELDGPVHASVLPAPPAATVVGAVGVAGALIGAVYDVLAGGATALATYGAFLGIVGVLETSGMAPDAGLQGPIVASLVSLLGASAVGPLLKRLVGLVVPKRAVSAT